MTTCANCREAEDQRDIMLSAVLTQGARDRCTSSLWVKQCLYVIYAEKCLLDAVHRVSLVKPEKAKQVEDSILQRAQRGMVREKVTEDVVIQMLQSGSENVRSRASSVTFRRRDLDDDDEW